ncbi:DUF3800 domain-containing protein [Porticoccaceae bacterium]|jgi:hypothetical protein|nr:DUF3800 domain-containing protein [Porticoccaceae bacterium]MDA9014721.1 DUF3800 domain-containing protein [Porticoccaceae bacterium]
MRGSINIDDAGTPGVQSKSQFLDESRKSWAAVIIPETISDEVFFGINILQKGIKLDFGAEEFHATDIYGGRGKWKNVDVAKRIEIFELMAMIFEKFSLPIIYVTTQKSTLKELGNPKSKKGVWWDLENIEHVGLLRVCMKVHEYFLEFQKNDKDSFPSAFDAYVDEGLKKAKTKIILPMNYHDSFHNNAITFDKSSNNYGIQLADFAAFVISRTQWIYANQEPYESLKESDLLFLKLIGRLNILNMRFIKAKEEHISRELYDFLQKRHRKEIGLAAKTNEI